MKDKNTNLLIWIIPAYFLIAAIALLTPLHSDDFGTRIAGFPNFPNHFKRYMIWSGRLTPDFLASFILWSDSHIVRSLLNSLGTFGVIAYIAKIPYSIISKRINHSYVMIFYIVMSILWLTSPNLGQTSFWIVGATNYIWTNLFVLMVLDKLARNLKNSENERFSLLGIFLLSIVAACGNENISLVLVGTTFIFCAFSYIYNKTSIRIGLSSFAGSCIGAGILLLAPGNYRRMSMEGDWWKDASWGYKIWLWAFKKMPFIVTVDAPIIAIIVTLVLLVAFNRNIRKSWNEYRLIYISIPFFIFLTFIANLVLVASPAYPPRAANGQYILLMCALSSALLLALVYAKNVVIYAFSTVAISFGVWAYSLMARSYFYVYKQEEIRQEIMQKEKNRGNESATIPEYYFRTLFNEGDKFDLFKPKQIPYYFGLKYVNYIKPNFDYSIIKTNGQPINIPLGSYAKGIEAWFYNKSIIGKDNVIVIKLDHYNKIVWGLHEKGFGLKKSVIINSERYSLASEPRLYAIDGNAYFALEIGDKTPPANILNISD
ncbi:DUF6056 family protein [Enterobacter soli]|nr:DUF6056 family protein [Enterobacter soli]